MATIKNIFCSNFTSTFLIKALELHRDCLVTSCVKKFNTGALALFLFMWRYSLNLGVEVVKPPVDHEVTSSFVKTAFTGRHCGCGGGPYSCLRL